MSKSCRLVVLAYLVPTFPLGYLWHRVTFADRYKQLAMYREDAIISSGLVSMAVQAVQFARACPQLFASSSGHWLRGAVGFGVLLRALAWSLAALPLTATYRMSSVADFLVPETAFTFLQFLSVSLLVALAYREVAGARAGTAAA